MTNAQIIFLVSGLLALASLMLKLRQGFNPDQTWAQMTIQDWIIFVGVAQWPIVTLITILLSTQGIV